MDIFSLEKEVSSCKKCGLYLSKQNYVFSRGSPTASIFCVGEAPGFDEDVQGKPFVGRSGQMLDRAIRSIKFDPEKDMYVANILKCRPPDNRKPTDNEVINCKPYLLSQIDIIKPKVILTLGNTAIQNLLNITDGISVLRNKELNFNNIKVVATYHPSYIIRSGGISSKLFPLFIDDLKRAFERIR
jgi:DNA polymerase